MLGAVHSRPRRLRTSQPRPARAGPGWPGPGQTKRYIFFVSPSYSYRDLSTYERGVFFPGKNPTMDLNAKVDFLPGNENPITGIKVHFWDLGRFQDFEQNK